MIWTLGGDALVHQFATATDWPALHIIFAQLTHVAWQGLHAYDLVFPAFIFTSGVALALVVAYLQLGLVVPEIGAGVIRPEGVVKAGLIGTSCQEGCAVCTTIPKTSSRCY